MFPDKCFRVCKGSIILGISRHLSSCMDIPYPLQRAVFYADGLFETIRVCGGRAPLLGRHWRRLEAGLKSLGMLAPAGWSVDALAAELAATGLTHGRARLQVWRAPGGLYLPESEEVLHQWTTASMEGPLFEWPEKGLHVGTCAEVRLPVDAFSHLKTLNAARYVQAARLARAKGWDDALLLNGQLRVVEATSSNVFLVAGKTLTTPPLSEGCVAGVVRGYLLEIASRAGFEVSEKPVTFAALAGAEEVFLTNAVRGIAWVEVWEGWHYKTEKTTVLHQTLINSLT